MSLALHLGIVDLQKKKGYRMEYWYCFKNVLTLQTDRNWVPDLWTTPPRYESHRFKSVWHFLSLSVPLICSSVTIYTKTELQSLCQAFQHAGWCRKKMLYSLRSREIHIGFLASLGYGRSETVSDINRRLVEQYNVSC